MNAVQSHLDCKRWQPCSW